MECPKCNAALRIARSTFESEIGTTKVENVQLLVCVNPDCANHETNMESPTKVVETVRNPMN